ncbi:TRAP transporter large permease [Rhodospirillaceae bacterium SYSU D60014]|uniref:TRAP transporter large permease n=1 Tax=Virgifigura deserti TaxID=2268457 RepID=UPI000E665AF3
MALLALVASFVFLLLFGMPIGFALACSSTLYLLVADVNLLMIPQLVFAFLSKFVLLSVPLFIFAAQLMMETSMGPRIIGIANAVVGWMRGGLSQVNILSSMVFAGVSGAAIADASSIGTIMWRAMVKERYNPDYAAAVSAASAAVGPIIPPSIPMIVAGTMVDVSVTRLFMGGILPGVLMGIGMGIVAYVLARVHGHPSNPFPGVRGFLLSMKDGFIDLMMPPVVIGGIVFGFFTPTEASAVAVLYVLAIGALRREISLGRFVECCVSTVKTTGEVLFIASMAMVLAWVLVFSQIPQHLVAAATELTLSPFLLKAIIIAVVLVLGTFLSGMEALLITLPLFIPVVKALGLDVFHMTLVIVIAAMIGTITPPVGLTLYIMSSVSGRSIWAISRAILPFLLVNILVLALAAYVPWIVTAVPDLFAN